MERLIDNNRTDKNTTHSYIPLYESKFLHRRESVKRVLEVGIERGGSLLLWANYFPNAEVWGLDVMPEDKVPADLKNHPRIKILHSTNAYDTKLVSKMIQSGLYFDVLIDDGPHTLESMVFFAQYYSQLLAPNGVLCIEDIPNPDWKNAIAGCVPKHFQPFMECYDLRMNKNRWDDILFFIDHRIPNKITNIDYSKLLLL
jgi:hypothetical protein